MDNLIEPSMLNVTFDQRNQKYGAYELRINYEKRLKRSFFICILFLSSLISFGLLLPNPKISKLLIPAENDTNLIVCILDKFEFFDTPRNPAEGNNNNTVIPTQIGENPVQLTQSDSNNNPNQNNKNGNDGDGADNPQPKTGGSSNGSALNLPRNIPLHISEVIIKPDVLPQFPGGEKALRLFLDENLPYVNKSYETQKVVVQFIVEQNGEITQIQIINDTGTDSGEEIISFIKKMPNWIPGSFEGHPITVLFRLPITFEPLN